KIPDLVVIVDHRHNRGRLPKCGVPLHAEVAVAVVFPAGRLDPEDSAGWHDDLDLPVDLDDIPVVHVSKALDLEPVAVGAGPKPPFAGLERPWIVVFVDLDSVERDPDGLERPADLPPS